MATYTNRRWAIQYYVPIDGSSPYHQTMPLMIQYCQNMELESEKMSKSKFLFLGNIVDRGTC